MSSAFFFFSKLRFFLRALAKNGSFGFLSVGSCVGKNQMCHLRFGFFTLTDNSQMYAIVLYATSRVVKILHSYLSKLKIMIMCILLGLRYLYCFYSFLFNVR